MDKHLAIDRNGDLIFHGMALHAKGESKPSVIVYQDVYEKSVRFVNFDNSPAKFFSADGFRQTPRLLKSLFADSWWTVKPYS